MVLFDSTPTSDGRSPGEWATIRNVFRWLREWRMVRDGLASYRDLGYRTHDQDLPAYVLRRHAQLTAFVRQATEEARP